MSKISRRRFLEGSALLAAAAALPIPAFSQAAGTGGRAGANDRIRIAVLGLNGRGMSHVSAFAGMDDVDVVAVCDPDSATFDRAVRVFTTQDKPEPKTYQDLRRMLDTEKLDAVSIATPNHWHSLSAIWAMQAGLDVYVEKPGSHNVFEGRKMVEAARKYNRICQVGTQSRANPGMRDAIAYLHSGKLGKVSLARGLCYKGRGSIGRVTSPQQPPDTVDYSVWLGPASEKGVMRGRFHYDWHWQYDYGNGDIGNQGAHEMDKARWGLNKHVHPNSIVCVGGRFGYRDNGDTPNTQVAFFDYGDAQLIFEVRGLSTPALEGVHVGNIWYGTEGMMVSPSYSSAVAYDNDGNEVERFGGGGDHYRNFIDAMRSRRRSDLFCDVEEGHMSASLCHLANVSYLSGSQQSFSVEPEIVAHNSEAAETLGRFREHLSAEGIDLERWSYRIGQELEFDPSAEQIRNSVWANRMLTRDYRAPFVVPDKV